MANYKGRVRSPSCLFPHLLIIAPTPTYRFDANETGYTISTDEGDNRVTVKAGADPVPRYFFEFHADAYGDARQGSGFRAGYGYEKGAQLISRDGHSLFTNRLIPLRAVLGGTAVEYADALIPTSSSSTWGAVKLVVGAPSEQLIP